MFRRSLNPLKSNSFLLFGARGVGKSTLISELLKEENFLEIDLLNPLVFEQATLGFAELVARIESAVKEKKWIFIDEVQRYPKLLDVAQSFIDKEKARFVLSGSSARKLKRGSANLLAGRAYNYSIFPLTYKELDKDFDLNTYLSYGGLPHIWNIKDKRERITYLRSYVATYLKEEIAEEQIIRKLEPFSRFLQVAAQSSGKILNYSKISKDVGVSDQTVKTYFQILEDTLVGFILPAYDSSIRKSARKAPKFYYFDTGVLRALWRTVDQTLEESNYQYGNLFEHFIINQIKNEFLYLEKDYSYSYYRTFEDEEIDLVIERPGKPHILIEIKSANKIKIEHTKTIKKLSEKFNLPQCFILSKDPEKKLFDSITCVHWEDGIKEILGSY
ncbi:MAG TPA: ATP-binding protein [Oligoflexia bacterium]|nr:ATP-binding protein [Oligoflexia bacterium]HMP49054.1 ATP-binding protein [Oligoflexia bacterium]